MGAYGAGDTAAFDALYARHRGPLFRYFLRQCRARSDAEELFQETWMRLIRAREGYVAAARFTTFLYRVAHNILIDHYRRASRVALRSYEEDSLAVDEVAADAHAEPDAQYATRRRVERFAELLDALPEAQREAFLLHEEAEMSIEEIAEATGVGRETAKSRLRYAVARLRKGMEAHA